MQVGFGPNKEAGIEEAIDFISKSNDFRVVYTWDSNDNVKDIFYSSAKHNSAFLKRFAWDSDDNLIHVRLENVSSPQPTQLSHGVVYGNDGRSFLSIPQGIIASPASIKLRTSVNKKYCLSQDDSDYISSTSVECDSILVSADQQLKFNFSFSTLRYLSPKSEINLFMKVGGDWELIGNGFVDDTGYLITANMRRL